MNVTDHRATFDEQALDELPPAPEFASAIRKEAFDGHPELVEPFLHQLVPTARTKFTALHGAFRTGGTFLYVPPDVQIAVPIQTLSYLDADGVAVFPHTLLVADRGSEVTFIDRYASPRVDRALSDAVVEIFVSD